MRFKISALFLVLSLILSSCGNSTAKGIEIGEGEFLISPQEFIDQWNESVISLQKSNTNNADLQHIILLPDFEENRTELEMDGRGLKVRYTINEETGNLKQIELSYYSPSAKDEQAMTFGFICGAIPTFINPKTSFSMDKDLGMMGRGTDSTIAFDGDKIKYQYSVVDGMMHSVTISTKW